MKHRSKISPESSTKVQAEVSAANREGRAVELSAKQLESLGHRKRPLTRAIRAFCLDCMGGNRAEVRRCTSVGCSLYPYRLGTNPYHEKKGGFPKPPATEPVQEQRGPRSPKAPQPTGGSCGVGTEAQLRLPIEGSRD